MDEIFSLLDLRSSDEGYTYASEQDVLAWAGNLNLSFSDFLDRIGIEIAKRYNARAISFEFGDSLVNELWAQLICRVGKHDDRWPYIFDEVYLAFDAGEFHRKPDKSDDPVAEFTTPAISAVVAKYS